MYLDFQFSIRTGIHRQALNVHGRLCLQPYGAIDSTEQPPVRLAFGSVHGAVVGVLLHPHFYLVGASIFQ